MQELTGTGNVRFIMEYWNSTVVDWGKKGWFRSLDRILETATYLYIPLVGKGFLPYEEPSRTCDYKRSLPLNLESSEL